MCSAAVLFSFVFSFSRQINLSMLPDLQPNLLHLCQSPQKLNSLLAVNYYKRLHFAGKLGGASA